MDVFPFFLSSKPMSSKCYFKETPVKRFSFAELLKLGFWKYLTLGMDFIQLKERKTEWKWELGRDQAL